MWSDLGDVLDNINALGAYQGRLYIRISTAEETLGGRSF